MGCTLLQYQKHLVSSYDRVRYVGILCAIDAIARIECASQLPGCMLEPTGLVITVFPVKI